MINRKGGTYHRLTGRIFFAGMTGVFVSAVLLSILRPNLFLFMVGFFSYYLACSGYRILYLKSHHKIQKCEWLDWLISGTGIVFGLALISFSFFWFQSRGIWGFVPLAFGLFCSIIAYKDFRNLYQPQQHKLSRLVSHGTKMGGAFAATVTAFTVVNLSLGIYSWVLWVLPGALIGIWTFYNLKALKSINKNS
jgi:hypothetical protein